MGFKSYYIEQVQLDEGSNGMFGSTPLITAVKMYPVVLKKLQSQHAKINKIKSKYNEQTYKLESAKILQKTLSTVESYFKVFGITKTGNGDYVISNRGGTSIAQRAASSRDTRNDSGGTQEVPLNKVNDDMLDKLKEISSSLRNSYRSVSGDNVSSARQGNYKDPLEVINETITTLTAMNNKLKTYVDRLNSRLGKNMMGNGKLKQNLKNAGKNTLKGTVGAGASLAKSFSKGAVDGFTSSGMGAALGDNVKRAFRAVKGGYNATKGGKK